MPYHVQLQRGHHVARAFNLELDELRRQILLPWVANRRIELGDKGFKPEDSKIIVLEGPRLESPDLAMSQGWTNAQRKGTPVTRELLDSTPVLEGAAAAQAMLGGGSGAMLPAAAERPTVAMLAESPEAASAARELLARLGLPSAAWAPLRAAIITRQTGGTTLPAAVMVALDAGGVTTAGDIDWWLDVGLALGAFGPRAVVALPPGRTAPAAVRDAGAVTLTPDGAPALAERLREAGVMF